MAVYSVVGRDDEPEDEQEKGGEAAVLRYVLAATKADDARSLRGNTLEVVLDLPELVPAEDAPGDWWSAIRDRVFWVGIAAGGLLAIVLIWNPNKQEPRQVDQAPAWSTTADVDRAAVSPGNQSSQPGIEVADAPRYEATENAAAPQSAEEPISIPAAQQPPIEQHPLEAPAPGHDAAPSADEFGRPRSEDASSQTARGPSDAVWDGRAAAPAQPGEAAPTGTIINTLVNP